MNDSDKDKLKDVLSTIDPVEFHWDETNTTVGIIAQDVSTITLSGDPYDIGMDTMGSIDLTNIGLSNGITTITGSGSAGNIMGGTYTIGSLTSASILSADTTEYGKTTIKTAKNTIDLDELADMMETLKKRLLILTPNFEKHEKYPMLKELYNEYKALEALLSGPDSDE